ncbi:MAG: hypothetical protein NVS9B1_26500 [Candidatus Dormibacteraceae bacterium]
MALDTYGFSVATALSIDAAEARVKELLKEEGFGVLTEIDIRPLSARSSMSRSGPTGSWVHATRAWPTAPFRRSLG